MWILMFFGWLDVHSLSVKSLINQVIPESVYSILFFLTGIVLIAWPIVRRRRELWALHSVADNAQDARELLDVSPAQFEEMVAELYNLRGYQATRMGSIGDHGIDLLVTTPQGKKWVVQCKRWRGWVGEPVVRDFYGAMQHEKADWGVLVTTGTFSGPARIWAKGKALSLVDGKEFLHTWKQANNL